MSRYDDMPEAARQLMVDYDEIDIAEMLAEADARVTEQQQRIAELEAQLAEARSKYAPASDVRPGWTVRVGLEEFTVLNIFRQDARSLNLVYADNRMILADDEPVIVIHRCDTPT